MELIGYYAIAMATLAFAAEPVKASTPDVCELAQTVRGDAVEGNLDTGANVAFVVPKSLFERLGGGRTQASPAGQLMNSVVATARATLRGPIRIGAARLENVEVRVSEKFPEPLIGACALEQFTLLIDQRTQSVALCPASNQTS